MSKIHIQTTIRNYSRYPIQIVWENAQDLEHVAYLHSRTNRFFEMLYAGNESGSKYEYDVLVYRTVRKFYFPGISTFGLRRIVGEHNIYQIEHIPLLGMTTALNSMLVPNSDPEFPTIMVDEVVIEIPRWMSFMKSFLLKTMHRHAGIQFSEDEPFRERRQILQRRKISLPFSLFNRTRFDQLTEKFKVKINELEGNSHVSP